MHKLECEFKFAKLDTFLKTQPDSGSIYIQTHYFQRYLQKAAIKENACDRSLFLLFETVVSCTDPEMTFIQ